ncbi:hypothetical protein niasHT_021045 [Heterodera trifolii]|uniref:Uncharacterized protein n=1 Tax=Heterodera trifolii TaxID=157864 RepID=A0ABD2KD22_9BILA
MINNKILLVFLTIFVLANEWAAAGHGNERQNKRRKSSANSTENAQSGESVAETQSKNGQNEQREMDRPTSSSSADALAAGQNKHSIDLQIGQDEQRTTANEEQMLWPDQLLQQQTEAFISSDHWQQHSDQLPYHSSLPFGSSSDQMADQTFDDVLLPMALGIGQGHADNSAAAAGHQITASQSNQISGMLPPLPTSTVGQMDDFAFSMNSQMEPVPTVPTDSNPSFGYRQIMGPPPPRQQMPFNEMYQTNASAVHNRPNSFTRLLMHAQKPFLQLNIPRVQNPFQYGAQSSNWHGMPLESPPSSNWHGMQLESPPSLQSLLLNSPTSVVPRHSAHNTLLSPSLQTQNESVPIFQTIPKAERQNTADRYSPLARSSFFRVPNPPLTIREGNEQAAERHRQQQQQSLANVDRKMKRPMDEKAGEGPSAIGIENVQMARSENDSRTAPNPFIRTEDKVHQIIILSLYSMKILPSDFNNPIKTAMVGLETNFGNILAQMEYRLTKSNAKSVMEHVNELLLQRQKVNPIDELGWIMSDIQRQAIRMFGRPLFITENISHAAGEQQQQQQHDQTKNKVKFEEQKQSENYAMACFFFTRLYRKLAGLLETPFYGKKPSNRLGVKSLMEVLLIWFGMTREPLAEKFEKIIKETFPNNFNEKLNLSVEFEKIDETRERLNVAELAIEVTLAPLIGTEVFHLTLEQSLKMMERVISMNLATQITQKGSFNLSVIAHLARNYNSRLGAAFTFGQIFDATIKRYNYIGNFAVNKIIQIYSILYQTVLSYLSPEYELLAAKSNAFYKCWMAVKNFLAIALQQFADAAKNAHNKSKE